MKISYKWLCDYLPEVITPEKISTILTDIGLEVENIENYETIKGGLKKLIVGEVMTVSSIPKAEKIRLTQVRISNTEVLQIVCGAPNVAQGQKVIVALPDAVLYPKNGEPVTIKKTTIRGIESHGMLCAEDEIGIGDAHEGIMVLPQDTPIGKSVCELFDIYTDVVYEIGITPNRVDAMSHFGVARDICAYLSFHADKVISPKYPEIIDNITSEQPATPIHIVIQDKDDCKRYSGLQISNVTIASTPNKIKNRLLAIGQKSINNIVDLANYVLFELGQPLHTFDEQQIIGNEIIVKRASQDDMFLCLDEKERKLQSTDLMICNAQEPMCIAGVFGGLKSGIRDTTSSVFIESAWFNPVAIRCTSKYHNLRTEAAIHFEKYVDISQTVFALQRMAFLMKKYMQVVFTSSIQDMYFPTPQKEISFSMQYLNKVAGKKYNAPQVEKLLQSMQFEIAKIDTDTFTLKIPYYKTDIHSAIDVVEEVIRMDGMDNIPLLKEMTMVPGIIMNQEEQIKNKLATYLCGLGFYEVLNNSLTYSKQYDATILETAVKLKNSVSAEHDILRPFMLEGGLKNIGYNIAHKQTDLLLFEFGNTYTVHHQQYTETPYIALWMTGTYETPSWRLTKPIYTDFFRLKGICEQLFALFDMEILFDGMESLQDNNFNIAYGISLQEKMILQIAEVSPQKLQYYNIKQKVFYATINLRLFYTLAKQRKVKFKEINKLPIVERDIAFLIDKKIAFTEVYKALDHSGIDFLKNMFLFDLFENDKIGSDKKSMAIRFYLHHREKTLADEQINHTMEKIMQILQNKFNAIIRKEA